MNEKGEKIVDFSKCEQCEHFNEPDDNDICHDCLENPVNTYSHTPVNFKQKESKDEN